MTITRRKLNSITVLWLGLALSLPAIAKPKREHGAHVHGAAHMDMAIEGDHASLQITCDTHSLFGFEHPAVTTAEKNLVANSVKIFKENFATMVVFENRLGCTVLAKQVKIQPEGHDDDDDDDDHHPGEQHQSLFADYQVKCKTAIEPSQVQFAFTKRFPKILSITLQMVSDRNTLSQNVKGSDKIGLQ